MFKYRFGIIPHGNKIIINQKKLFFRNPKGITTMGRFTKPPLVQRTVIDGINDSHFYEMQGLVFNDFVILLNIVLLFYLNLTLTPVSGN